MAGIAIRRGIEASELRRLARLEDDGRVASRLLAIAAVLDGHSRHEAARLGGMDRQTDLALIRQPGRIRSTCGYPWALQVETS